MIIEEHLRIKAIILSILQACDSFERELWLSTRYSAKRESGNALKGLAEESVEEYPEEYLEKYSDLERYQISQFQRTLSLSFRFEGLFALTISVIIFSFG